MNRSPANACISRVLAVLICIGGLALFSVQPAHASEVGQSKKFGIGVYLGQPTGLTMKYFFSPKHALTGAIGAGWWGGNNLHFHVDYGYHIPLTRTADFDFKFWVGGGLKFFYFYHDYNNYYDTHWDGGGRAGLAIRVPLGIAFHLNKVPLDIFFELAPGVAFLPWIGFTFDGGIGVRYFF